MPTRQDQGHCFEQRAEDAHQPAIGFHRFGLVPLRNLHLCNAFPRRQTLWIQVHCLLIGFQRRLIAAGTKRRFAAQPAARASGKIASEAVAGGQLEQHVGSTAQLLPESLRKPRKDKLVPLQKYDSM